MRTYIFFKKGGGGKDKWCPLLGNESGGVKGVVVKEVVGFWVWDEGGRSVIFEERKRFVFLDLKLVQWL